MNPQDIRETDNSSNDRRDKGPVIGAVVFIVVGTVLLLEKLGYVPAGFALHFWPCIFIVIGIVKLVYAGGRPTGAVLIGLGVILQLNEMGITHLNFCDLWPVLSIVAGAAMLWQALSKDKPGLSANPPFHSLYVFRRGHLAVEPKDSTWGSLGC